MGVIVNSVNGFHHNNKNQFYELGGIDKKVKDLEMNYDYLIHYTHQGLSQRLINAEYGSGITFKAFTKKHACHDGLVMLCVSGVESSAKSI